MSAGWVVEALNAIQQADLSVRERRSARWQLFEVMKASAPSESSKIPVVSDVVEDIDTIVRAVRAASPRVSHVGDAVRWLRQQGHPDIAARVSRKSKARNFAGHPDAHLREEVLQIVRATATQKEGSVASAQREPSVPDVTCASSLESARHTADADISDTTGLGEHDCAPSAAQFYIGDPEDCLGQVSSKIDRILELMMGSRDTCLAWVAQVHGREHDVYEPSLQVRAAGPNMDAPTGCVSEVNLPSVQGQHLAVNGDADVDDMHDQQISDVTSDSSLAAPTGCAEEVDISTMSGHWADMKDSAIGGSSAADAALGTLAGTLAEVDVGLSSSDRNGGGPAVDESDDAAGAHGGASVMDDASSAALLAAEGCSESTIAWFLAHRRGLAAG